MADEKIWDRVQSLLDVRMPKWRDLIEHFGQVRAIKERDDGKRWSDDQIQEALVRAILSSNTDWDKIERVLSELDSLFQGYSLKFYAQLSEVDIDKEFVPWFKARKAASPTLARNLKYLIETSKQLNAWSRTYGSAEDYFVSLYERARKDPKVVALDIGLPGSRYKLPGFGVAIAAEALRNMGFNLAKPDRHILRATGSFGLIRFSKWPDRSRNNPPVVNKNELLMVMSRLEEFSAAAQQHTCYVDNAVWLICAKGGLGLSNAELCQLASL